MATDEAIANFVAVTGSDEKTAKHFLDAHGGSAELAIETYLDSIGGGGGPSTSFPSPPAGSRSNRPEGMPTRASSSGTTRPLPNDDPDYVRAPDAAKRARLIDHASDPNIHYAFRSLRQSSARDPFRNFQQEGRSMISDDSLEDIQHGQKLANLFAAPHDLMYHGTFQSARQDAKSQKKFLVVNIQKADEFDSHRLNRDVWKDDTVKNVLQSCCILWQQDHTIPEAVTYCERYHVHTYPHIGVLDPRTSRELWKHAGFIEPGQLATQIADVVSKYPLDNSQSKPPIPQQTRPPLHELPEDEQLAAAIAASLAETQCEDSKLAGDKEEVIDLARANSKDSDCKRELNPDLGSDKKISGSPVKAAALQPSCSKESNGKEEIVLPPEPEATDKDSTRIQFKLPNGKRTVRRFKKDDSVKLLFNFASTQIENEDGFSAGFDLLTTFPSKSLMDHKDKCIQEEGLCNASVVVKLFAR